MSSKPIELSLEAFILPFLRRSGFVKRSLLEYCREVNDVIHRIGLSITRIEPGSFQINAGSGIILPKIDLITRGKEDERVFGKPLHYYEK